MLEYRAPRIAAFAGNNLMLMSLVCCGLGFATRTHLSIAGDTTVAIPCWQAQVWPVIRRVTPVFSSFLRLPGDQSDASKPVRGFAQLRPRISRLCLRFSKLGSKRRSDYRSPIEFVAGTVGSIAAPSSRSMIKPTAFRGNF